MAQGKLKVKTKVPENVKNKKKNKGSAITKRANRPIQPKKNAREESAKLKQAISKSVNRAVEEEIRSRAGSSKTKLSKAQKAVADHHTKTKS